MEEEGEVERDRGEKGGREEGREAGVREKGGSEERRKRGRKEGGRGRE